MWRWKFLDWLFVRKPPASSASPTPVEDPDSAALRARLETLTQYPIQNLSLFKTALTHRSAIDRTSFASNERLEFLGDAVLDLVAAEYLYTAYPELDEGKLTKLRSLVVNAKTLAQHARALSLGKLLIISESAEAMKVRDSEAALSDAFEALIGAIYLDGGYARAQAFLRHHILDKTDFQELLRTEQNYKSVLLEYAQAHRLPLPIYVVTNEDGPSHNKTFTVAVKLGDEILGHGTGKSKKEAEQQAARAATLKLNLQSDPRPVSIAQ